MRLAVEIETSWRLLALIDEIARDLPPQIDTSAILTMRASLDLQSLLLARYWLAFGTSKSLNLIPEL
jgi:hypothetical protein